MMILFFSPRYFQYQNNERRGRKEEKLGKREKIMKNTSTRARANTEARAPLRMFLS